MMMPWPTYESDGRRLQCHALSVGRHTHEKSFRLARGGAKKPSSATANESAKEPPSARQRACSSPPRGSSSSAGAAEAPPPPPCSTSMSFAVAVPDGKGSFSTRIVCRRRGTAKKMPK